MLQARSPWRAGALGVSALLLLSGCGSLTVSSIQSQIQKSMNQQLASKGRARHLSVSATVKCPTSANLKPGAVFYCDANIAQSPMPAGSTNSGAISSAGSPQTETRKVKVTMQSSTKASWALQ